MAHTEPVLEIKKSNDKKIAEILATNKISLTVDEMKKVVKMLGRNPTLTEATMWSIQGSEHCSYKSSRTHLKMLPTTGPNVILGPSEDSGIIELCREPGPKGVRGRGAIGKKIGIVMSHESHNHPSQVVPYEGAATGVGGCVRDVLCMGAHVIASGDSLRFGETKNNTSAHIANGVVSGVAGYTDAIGVPNLTGDTYFNKAFNDNCLVNVVSVGVLKEEEIIHSYAPQGAAVRGYEIILVGKPTDYSGMGGAAFASLKLEESEKEKNKGAVQEPNPFLKRHIMQSTYDLFRILKEKDLFEKVGFKDLGAGGVMCATVEMAAKSGYGAEIDLRKVPVSYPDLPPHVIACSETQERMCWMVPPDLTKMILKHYNETWDLPNVSVGARAAVIGKVVRGNYVLWYDGVKVCDAKGSDITEGLLYKRAYKPRKVPTSDPKVKDPRDLNKVLMDVLSHENIACKLPIYESYDKDVQGSTVIEPGWADAGVMAPLWNRNDINPEVKNVGIALKMDANPRYGEIDPYWQAANAVVEGCRNVAAVGATPWCITDCLNYGSPEDSGQMWEFVRGVEGIRDALVGIGLDLGQDDVVVVDSKKPRRGPKPKKKKEIERFALPCISGNVSFYNLSPKGAIPPQALIATLGKLPDVRKAITMQIKGSGHDLYLIGPRLPEMGGSVYFDVMGELGASLPKPDFDRASREIKVVTRLITAGLVESCHDIADGGLATTVAEMCIGGTAQGTIGAKIDLSRIGDFALRTGSGKKSKPVHLSTVEKFFGETGGFVLEIPHNKLHAAEKIAARFKVPLIKLGHTTEKRSLVVFNEGEEVINVQLNDIKSAWLSGLRDKL